MQAGNGVKRNHRYIKTRGAMDWQRSVLERIHVYEMDGPKTVLFFDTSGNVMRDHNAYAFSVPMEYFAPGKKEALKQYIFEHKRDPLNAPYERDRDLLAERVASAGRAYLEKHRPAEFLYHLTPAEDQQIARIFVELNKYPEISSQISRESYWLIGSDETVGVEKISTCYKEEDCVAGYFWTPDNAIVIGFPNDMLTLEKGIVTNLRLIIAEETIHAYDIQNNISRKQHAVTQQDIEDAKAHLEKMEMLAAKMRYAGMPRANITLSEDEYQQVLALGEFTTHVDRLRGAVGHPLSLTHGELKRTPLVMQPEHLGTAQLDSLGMFLEDAAHFQKHDLYKERNFTSHQTEYFTKTALVLRLRRHLQRYAENGQDRQIEAQLFSTPYQQKILALLDEEQARYEAAYTEKEREAGEKVAQGVAIRLEREKRGSTFYSLPDYSLAL